MVVRKFHVKKDERALLFERGDFVEILRPGEHFRFDPLRRLSVEKFALGEPRFEHRLADFLVKAESDVVSREFHVVELGATEVGLRYQNGVLAEVLAPNTRRLYFKGYLEQRFERVDVATDFAVEPKLVPQLLPQLVPESRIAKALAHDASRHDAAAGCSFMPQADSPSPFTEPL